MQPNNWIDGSILNTDQTLTWLSLIWLTFPLHCRPEIIWSIGNCKHAQTRFWFYQSDLKITCSHVQCYDAYVLHFANMPLFVSIFGITNLTVETKYFQKIGIWHKYLMYDIFVDVSSIFFFKVHINFQNLKSNWFILIDDMHVNIPSK